ncbi:hypothetical protein LTR09_012953 [Extremus antarcticus]|uniref:Uncharacterized protein n=1 Tax=Extremus antarcticus TaxID=702011 RepID=A0AAJ0D4H9_9PEZI|nr:hypothetical protein LTR09_012953 [Extremus antarcticus]
MQRVVDSRHAIRCVVGLEFAHRNEKQDKQAALSIWRPASRGSGSLQDQHQQSTIPREPKKFRKRKRTPDEELGDGREADFTREEDMEAEKDGKEGGAWSVRVRRRFSPLNAEDGRERRRRRRERSTGRAVGSGG